MRAVTWQGPEHVSVEDVPDPLIQQPTDAVIRVTSTAICGSVGEIREQTQGRGPDAVGMEAEDSPVGGLAQTLVGKLPDVVARPLMEHAGVDRLAALHTALDLVRRGGTVSLAGVYGGAASPMPLLTMFDKQLRMGQCNVRSWTDELLPLVEDPADPLGVGDLVTHRLPLEEAAVGYDLFQKKHDGCIKVVLDPTIAPAPIH